MAEMPEAARDGIDGAAAVELRQSGKASRKHGGREAQLLPAQRLHLLGTLAAGLAHDFNNLLEVILGFASLARRRMPANDPLAGTLGMIEQSAKRAGDLARQMLELGRSEEAAPRRVNLAQCIERVAKIASRTFDRNIHVQARIEPNLPWVRGSPGQLEQALLNLCVNARDAMPKGGKLALEAHAGSRPGKAGRRPGARSKGEMVLVEVRDTGAGIEPGVLPRIFEPFFSTKPKTEGSGLGLTVVERIVKAHHGHIKVESARGEGSTFTLYFPAVSTSRVPEEKEEPETLWQGSGTVLAVDDEPLVLAFVEQGLSQLGYQVLKAESGKRACEIYAHKAPEIGVVLLDLVMPEMDGFETYSHLKAINPKVRVILSSGYNTGRLAREARGSAVFLGKPYTLEALSEALLKAQQH